MSPLVTRPSLPDPGTVAASMPLSAEILRTEGASGASVGGAFEVVGVAEGGAAAADLAGAAAGFAAAAVAPSLICPSNAPTATVSPSLATISPSVPAEGAGTSMVTLSVSSSTNGSSTATESPAFLNQRPMVASVTDSPSVGTRISVIWCSPRAVDRHFPDHPRLKNQAFVRKEDAPDRASPLPLVQSVVEQRLELSQVLRHQPGGGGSGGGTAGITRTLVGRVDLVQHPLEIRLDEMPGAHVARLFLAPHQFGALEAPQLLHQCLQRHRVELLDTHQVDIVDTALFTLVVQIVIHLAGAEHDAADLRVGDQLDFFVWQHHRVVVENAMERGVGSQFIELRHRALVAQQRLRRHQYQRLAYLSMQLSPQHMEEIGRRG